MIRPLGTIACAVLALLAGQWGTLQWEKLLIFINRINVGTGDPVMGRDIGFYLFSLPLMESLTAFTGFTLTTSLFITAAA